MAPQVPAQIDTIFRQSFNSWNFWFPTIIYGFLGALGMYNNAWINMDMLQDRFRATYRDTVDTFDFIVVGAGSSGSVVANRLSIQYNVLLLEAGGEPNPWCTVPAMSLMMLNYPGLDWMYKTVPQKSSCGALPNRQSGWSGGKALGGTSNLNFLIYLRGHPRDYDYIANLTGDSTWGYDGVTQFFKSVEDYKGPWDNDKYHGHKGDMPIQLPPYLGMGETFVAAGREMGYPITDLNAPFDEGFSLIVFPTKNGRRMGSYQSFLAPIRNRPSLTIYKFSQVTKVLLRGPENEVYGVEYERHGITKVAYAKREVILSGGSIGSPKILMMSGIGPKKHLESVGVKPKVDLPVGLNLQDHISLYLGPFFVDKPITMLLDRDLTAKSFLEFTQEGKGELTSSGCSATAFLTTKKAKENGEGNWPDIQFILLGTGVYQRMDKDMSHAFHIREDVMQKYFAHAKGKDSFQIIVSLARPKARGDMKLSGPKYTDEFLIDPKYLDNDHDVQTLIEGVKMAVNLVENTTTFQNIGGRFTNVVFPGCEHVIFRSDAYWECFIRQYSITLHHIVGPCSMGREDSKDAVVDSQLRVLGTKGLRVVDASVLPKVPVSNTNAPAVMVGEKGAHMIIQSWKNTINGNTNEIIR